MSLILGIDASRNRSGGARAHIIGILTDGDPRKHGIQEIHIWAFKALLDAIPDRPWLKKHGPAALEASLPRQLIWQGLQLSIEAKSAGCDIILTMDASTLCRFRPMVVMSQDMLSYEPGVMATFGLTKARLRLLAILLAQNRALRSSDGAIFVTNYASKIIQQSCGGLENVAVIPYGIAPYFNVQSPAKARSATGNRPIRCLYVSNIAMYKHQWVVIQGLSQLRKRGYDLQLILAGGGAGKAKSLVDTELSVSDPDRAFVELLDFIPHKELPGLLSGADIFIFASACESLPTTLLEAMAVGMPIACSNCGPMPEVLADGGVYFDPRNADSIASAVERLIQDGELRTTLAARAKTLAAPYTWSLAAESTWDFVVRTYSRVYSHRAATQTA